jgi:malate dehydrogenase (oxaloacetate-decarboxylating)(NADP+)
MIHGSAQALANALSPAEKADELLYPALARIRDISAPMTRDLIRVAQREGVDTQLQLRELSDAELEKYIVERVRRPLSFACAPLMSA